MLAFIDRHSGEPTAVECHHDLKCSPLRVRGSGPYREVAFVPGHRAEVLRRCVKCGATAARGLVRCHERERTGRGSARDVLAYVERNLDGQRWWRPASSVEVHLFGAAACRALGWVPPMAGGAVNIWKAAAASSWNVAASWSTGVVPAAGDAVQIGSGTGATQSNCTLNVASSVASVDFTGYTGTFTHNASTTLTVSGTLFTLVSTMTYTLGASSGALAFTSTSGTTAITAAGKTVGAVTFSGVGGTWSLQDAFKSSGSLTLSNGTLTATSSVQISSLNTNFANARTLNMGSGTWTLTGTGGWTVNTSGSGLTLNAQTSTISLTDTSATGKTFAGGGKVYNNLSITGGGTGAITLSGSNTFATWTINAPKTVNLTAGTIQTLTSLVATGSAGNLIVLQSATASSTATISATTQFTGDFLTVIDITAAGAVPFAAGANSTLTRTVNWVNALITNSDSATGADAAQVAASGSEAAAGTEASAVTLQDSETHSGAETAALALGGADSGGGGEAAKITVAAGDAAAGGESGRLAFSGADQGSGADAAALMLLANESVLGGEEAGLWLEAVENATGSDAERMVFLNGDQGTGSSSEAPALSESETAGAAEGTAIGLGSTEDATGTEADRTLYTDGDGGSGAEGSAPMGVAGSDAAAALEAWGGRALQSPELAAGADGQSLTLGGVEVGFSADGGAVVVLSGDAGDSTDRVALAVFSSDEGALTAVLVFGVADGDHAGGLDVGVVYGLVLLGVGSSLGLTGIAAPIGRL